MSSVNYFHYSFIFDGITSFFIAYTLHTSDTYHIIKYTTHTYICTSTNRLKAAAVAE